MTFLDQSDPLKLGLASLRDDGINALQQTMTHWPEQPNPAEPYLRSARDFAKGGITGALRGGGAQLPEISNTIGNILQSDAANTVFGIVSPLKTERFEWPIHLLSGKTVDMPIIVNPSRSMIQRELAQAPHGDLRAIKSPNGDIYMWPANEAMHVDIANAFDIPFSTREQLQQNSYLFNKKDVDVIGRFSDFNDLMKKLALIPGMN